MSSGSTEPPILPSLAPFLHHFAALVSSPACPSSLFVHSPSRSPVLLPSLLKVLKQATATLRSSQDPPTVEQLLPKVALVDLSDVHSVKAAFDRILNQLSGWETAGEARWEDRNSGIEAWDGSMSGVKVVRREKKRKAAPDGRGRRSKRARTEVVEDSEAEGSDEGDFVEEDGQEDGREEEWKLEWDRSSAGLGEKSTLAPLRNTVEAFQHSLSSIFASSSSSLRPSAESALDPAAGLRPASSPSRRFIVFTHGELLSELAGSGGATGAAKETGVGLTFASTMYRLGQLTGLPITVITVSRLAWTKARESMVGLPSPELLTFDDVGDADAVTLLSSRFASSPLAQPGSSDSLSSEQLVQLFSSLAFVIRTTFGKSATQLEEHAYLCAKFWPRWKEVVERSNPPIAPTDTARLSIALKADFSAELDRFALPRQSLSAVPIDTAAPSANPSSSLPAPTQLHGFSGTISALPKQPTYLAPAPPTPEKSGGSSNFFSSVSASASATPTRPTDPSDPFLTAPGPSTPLRHQALSTSSSSSAVFTPASAARAKHLAAHTALAKSLPIVGRFLLIAAYFAAVNPPKSDVRMFVRVDELEGVAKKGKKARKQSAKKAGTSPSKNSKPVSLYGGKSFAYERMIAIFESILDDRTEYALGSVSVAGQVQTLLHLRLLIRASSESNTDKILDGVKLKCPLAKDVVDALAQNVGWKEWRERLVGEE